MKKFFHLFISVSVVFLGLPLRVFAVQEINTPPIFVSPVIPLNQEVVQLKNTVLNQDRANRDQEVEDRSLAEHNAELTQKIVDLQNQLARQSQNSKDNDFYSRLENLQQLKDALENYGRGLDERNRNLIARNEGTSALRARIDKLEHLFDPVIGLTKDVQAMKSPSATKLASSLQDQKEFLVFKSRSLIEKYQQLLDFKAQLAATKEELQNLQRKYEKALEQQSRSTPKASPWEGISENLKYQKMSLEKYENALLQKDRHIADLEAQIIKKDTQIAQLKSDLAFAHVEISRMHQDLANLRQAYATDDGAFERIRANIMVLKRKLAAAQAQGYTSGLSNEDIELIKLKGDVAVLNYQLENDQEDFTDYENQIRQLHDTIDHLTAQSKTQTVEFKTTTTSLQGQIEDLKKKAAAPEEVADLQKQLEQQKKESAQLSSMLDIYQQKIDKIDTGSKEEISALQSDLEAAQKNLAQREKDLKKVKDYFFEFEKHSVARNTELKSKDEQLAALQERLTVAEEKLKTSVDESELTKEIANDKKMEKEFEVAKEKIGSLMEDLYFKDKEIARLKMLSTKKERASKEQARAYKHQKQEIEHLRRDLKAAMSK